MICGLRKNATAKVGCLLLFCGIFLLSSTAPLDAQVKGWKKGQGWGWIWGQEDEVGSLNAMTPEMSFKGY